MDSRSGYGGGSVTKRKPRMDYESQLARGFAELKEVIRDKKLSEETRYKIVINWFLKGLQKIVRK